MHREEQDVLLRVMIGENDRLKGKPLYEAIVMEARRLGLAGATVIRGVMGFGADNRVKSLHLLDLANDLPMVIEIVDSPEKIEALMPFLDEHVIEGLVTMETVRVVRYGKIREKDK